MRRELKGDKLDAVKGGKIGEDRWKEREKIRNERIMKRGEKKRIS